MVLPILSPETEAAMLKACVRELGPSLWPFMLVDDATGEPNMVTGVRWLHRLPDDDTTDVIVVPSAAVVGATNGQLVFRPELTLPHNAGDEGWPLEPFLDGWRTGDGAKVVALPADVLDSWIPDDAFEWQTGSMAEDDPDGPEPELSEEGFACVVFGVTLGGPLDIEVAGIVTTSDAAGRLAVDEVYPGLLGALVMRMTGPLEALSLVLYGLVTQADGDGVVCTSTRRIEEELTAILATDGPVAVDDDPVPVDDDLVDEEEDQVAGALGQVGAALVPFELTDGETSTTRLVTGVRWMHDVGDGRRIEVVVVPRRDTASVTTGNLVFRPELTTPPGAVDGRMLIEPFLEPWYGEGDAQLLVLLMAGLREQGEAQGYDWAERSIGAGGAATDLASRVLVLGHAVDGEGVTVTTGVDTTCDADGLLALDGAADEVQGLLGGLALGITGPDDAQTVALHGLVTRDAAGSFVCLPAAAVEQDLTVTLAPHIGPA